MDVSIYLCENAERKLMPSDWSMEEPQDPERTDYRLAWYGKVNADDLEDVFKIFNRFHPEDYNERSLSVGDIVGDGKGLWYCDSIGWTSVKWRKV